MDFDKNADYYDCLNNPSAYKAKGISYKFTSESSYVEPVSLDEFKTYGLIDFDSDDSNLQGILTSARQQAEQYLQRSLGIRTVQFKALECPPNYKLAWSPIDTLETAGYTLFDDIFVEGGKEITLSFTTDASLVNFDIKIAIMSQALYLYQNRGEMGKMAQYADGFKEKLNPYRYVTFP